MLKETEGESDLESKKNEIYVCIYSYNVPFFKKKIIEKLLSLCVCTDCLLRSALKTDNGDYFLGGALDGWGQRWQGDFSLCTL